MIAMPQLVKHYNHNHNHTTREKHIQPIEIGISHYNIIHVTMITTSLLTQQYYQFNYKSDQKTWNFFQLLSTISLNIADIVDSKHELIFAEFQQIIQANQLKVIYVYL